MRSLNREIVFNFGFNSFMLGEAKLCAREKCFLNAEAVSGKLYFRSDFVAADFGEILDGVHIVLLSLFNHWADVLLRNA